MSDAGGSAAPGFFSLSVDASRFRPTRMRIIGFCSLFLAVAIGVIIVQFSQARDFILPSGSVIGGDFLAFHTAARAAAEGAAASIYDPKAFEALLLEVGPPKDHYGLTWQYPPTYFLIIFLFAFIGYAPGYAVWTGATAAIYFAAMRASGFRGLFLFVILAAPSTFQAVITGQNGFLTAALLAVAALYPDKRPIVAGLAAALLTVKPQLGLLLPIAYLAGGCSRAFFVAAIGAAALAALSVAAFGADVWTAFLGGAAGASDNLAKGVMPLFKMTTPFAAARFAGLSSEFAMIFHGAFAIAATVLVAVIWRRVREADLRAAALLAGVFLVAPYGFYYEAIILALPAAILARRALQTGWLKHEQVALGLIFLLPMFMPGDPRRTGFALGFVAVLIVAASVVRRIAHEYPGAFRLELRSA